MGRISGMAKWGAKLRRLRGMGVAELACRGRQETSALLERWGVLGRAGGSPEGVIQKLWRVPDLVALRRTLVHENREGAARERFDRFKEGGPSRFFAGAVDPSSSKSFPKEAGQAILGEAEAICQRRFDLLGYRGLFFGDPVDWHRDPISGRRAPLLHWKRIDPLDAAVVGDSKVIWELNRHQWLVRLGQAYRLTREERYAREFAGQLRDWKRANPRGMGINWASSLEAALRLISWCWALFLFRDSRALDADLFLEIAAGIRSHAAHVEKYLSLYFSPNTHLTGEALGLFYAGVIFPEWKSAARWRETGSRILIEQIDRQVLPDGVYFEQATCYQRYSVETYLHFLILAARNSILLPDRIRETVQRMLDFLLAVRRPDGSVPEIGDADGGRLLPLARRRPDDLRGVFSSAAAFFGRADYAWAAGEIAPETVWLMGPKGGDAFAELSPSPPDGEPSRIFRYGGYAVMRSSWEPAAHHFVFDAGPLGCPVSAGHGHADLLSIQCSIFGEPFVVDPGTFCYTSEPEYRDFFRGSAAHSTVLVDGLPQAIPDGPFRWESRPEARLLRWISTREFDLAEGEHDAYLRLPDPVRHRRRVVFIKPGYWILVDQLDGLAEHQVELRFQLAPLSVAIGPSLWARIRGRGGPGLLLRPFSSAKLGAEVREGECFPIQGWMSSDYGQRRPAPVLIYSTRAPLPLRVVTVLLPVEDPDAPPPELSAVWGEHGEPLGIVFGDGQERVSLGEEVRLSGFRDPDDGPSGAAGQRGRESG